MTAVMLFSGLLPSALAVHVLGVHSGGRGLQAGRTLGFKLKHARSILLHFVFVFFAQRTTQPVVLAAAVAWRHGPFVASVAPRAEAQTSKSPESRQSRSRHLETGRVAAAAPRKLRAASHGNRMEDGGREGRGQAMPGLQMEVQQA